MGQSGRRRSRRGRTATGQIICYRCGKNGHIAAKCVAVVNVVDSGHIEKVVLEQEEEEPTTHMLVAQFNCIEARCNRGEV